jgi:hypothetical protein
MMHAKPVPRPEEDSSATGKTTADVALIKLKVEEQADKAIKRRRLE